MSKVVDSFGSDAGLKDGPRSVEYDSARKGGVVDSFAAKAPISETPVSMLPDRKPGNHIESFAAKAPLNETPNKGYDSYNTPMSKRAIKQSK